jgi:ribose-phosphate pyrophosphokinase
VLHKQRLSGRDVAIRRIVGEVEGRPCLIVDDMISTGSTILKSAEALREAGAEGEMVVAATHGVFSGDALERLRDGGITDLWITDSIAVRSHPGLQVVPIASVLAEGVRRLTNAGSVE